MHVKINLTVPSVIACANFALKAKL